MPQTNQNSRPMVSIVMVTYNQADIIDNAIAGVVHQDFNHDMELIIADDASTDATREVCESWQKRYPHIIRIINNQSNLGLQRNYLTALRHCRGKYIAMCDADDYWCSRHKLTRQTEWMETHPECSITFHRVINLYTGGKRRTMSLSNGKQLTETTITDLSRSNYITNLSVMYRADALSTAGYPEWIADVPSPDYILHMLFAANGTIHYFPQAMGVYCKHTTGTWSLAGADKQVEMSIREREFLLNHFIGNETVTSGLSAACTSILINAIARNRLAGNTQQQAIFTDRLKLLRPDMSDDDINSRADQRAIEISNGKSRIATALSTVRRFVSMLLPVPKPC